MNEANRIHRYIAWARAELDTLENDVNRAAEIQWVRAPTSRPDNDEIRRKNVKPDPTADTALDAQRLAVREALRQVDADLLRLLHGFKSMSGRLQQSVKKWEGHR